VAPDPDLIRETTPAPPTRRAVVAAQFRRLAQAIREGDDSQVEEVILALSRRSRLLAPLALVVGAFSMLFQGIKLLFTNWRLTLVQVLPAMWIWAAMLDLKAHALHGKEFHIFRGPLLAVVLLVIAALTAGTCAPSWPGVSGWGWPWGSPPWWSTGGGRSGSR
jgi:hypothetical protein